MINSSSNRQIKELMKLKRSASYRAEKNAFVIEGRKLFQEALSMGLVERAYLSEAGFLELSGSLGGAAYELVSDALFRQISDTVTPQGVLAVAARPAYDAAELLKAENANLLFLENLQDPGNLGTILRTAEAAGVTGIILSRGTVDMYNPKTVRSTMGAVFRVPFVYAENFYDTLKRAGEQGIVVYAACPEGGLLYDQEDYPIKCGVLIGNEGNGLTKNAVSLAARRVGIPMCGRTESLNAAVAAAVLMYEIYRQKRGKREL